MHFALNRAGSSRIRPFFRAIPVNADLGRFQTLSPKSGATYHFAKDMRLKRKSGRNNFFCTKNAKFMKKVLVIKNKYLPLYPEARQFPTARTGFR